MQIAEHLLCEPAPMQPSAKKHTPIYPLGQQQNGLQMGSQMTN